MSQAPGPLSMWPLAAAGNLRNCDQCRSMNWPSGLMPPRKSTKGEPSFWPTLSTRPSSRAKASTANPIPAGQRFRLVSRDLAPRRLAQNAPSPGAVCRWGRAHWDRLSGPKDAPCFYLHQSQEPQAPKSKRPYTKKRTGKKRRALRQARAIQNSETYPKEETARAKQAA